MLQFITVLFTTEEYELYVIGGAAVAASITISTMVKIIAREFRNK